MPDMAGKAVVRVSTFSQHMLGKGQIYLQVKAAHGGLGIVLQTRMEELGEVHEVEVHQMGHRALAGDKGVARCR